MSPSLDMRTSAQRLLALVTVLGVTTAMAVVLAQSPTPAARPALPSAPPRTTGPVDLTAPQHFAAGARSARNASYSIDARLDTAARTITGREVITWRNIARRETSLLRLHLYWNAWRSSQTTWMRERALTAASRELFGRPEADWAAIDISAIRLVGAGAAPPVDLLASMRFTRPDDDNAHDFSLAEVPLPLAVRPNDTINLEVEWTARVPRTFARTGAIGDYYFIAHWFPKVAVLDEFDWKGRQFHSGTEFFADYGVYDVRLRVPTGWLVGATGTERGRTDHEDGTTTHRYIEEDVHDFAWTTSPAFVERRARFEEPGLPFAEMRLLLQPEHLGQAERHFAATRAALRSYGRWFGAYPYGHITIVDPAWQSGTGSMEYPTLISAGTRWLAPARVAEPEQVVVHETGHQLWYGLVATNEFDHAWMDEGLNMFAEARALDVEWGQGRHSERYFGGFVPWVFDDIVLRRQTDGNGLHLYRRHATSDRPDAPSWRYSPSTGRHITYNKTALWLQTLENHLGWNVLQPALADYFERFQFRHPSPSDFFAAVTTASGRDLTWFFDQVYRSAAAFDYGIESVVSEPATLTGFVDRDGKRVFVEAAREAPFLTRAIVRRYGEGTFPVDVRITFDDGTHTTRTWDGKDRWAEIRVQHAHRALSVIVDPDAVLALDINRTNNSRSLQPQTAAAAAAWSWRWLVWAQDLLLTYGFFI